MKTIDVNCDIKYDNVGTVGFSNTLGHLPIVGLFSTRPTPYLRFFYSFSHYNLPEPQSNKFCLRNRTDKQGQTCRFRGKRRSGPKIRLKKARKTN